VKKLPSQQRSRESFDAIVDAATWLLPRLGYAGTTTNHVAERAGVNIATLYEYFPGKDAIVAQVADRMVERVMERLAKGASRVMQVEEDDAVREWIEIIFDTIASERGLVAVFTNEIPFTNELDPVRTVGQRLLRFSHGFRAQAGSFVRDDFSPAAMHLLINLVSSTILQLVQNPPKDVTHRALLDELAKRVEEWIRRPRDATAPRT
jgi:AcrR family transcriptional regulator